MQLHQIQVKNKKRKKKRIGRGGKRGTYSGRGMKGQKSRAGAKFKPMVRDVFKRYPKLKGYRQKSVKVKKGEIQKAIINLNILEKQFKAEEEVNPENLLEKKIISKIKGRMPKVKILAQGELTKKLIFQNCQISQAAKKKIEKANGTIK